MGKTILCVRIWQWFAILRNASQAHLQFIWMYIYVISENNFLGIIRVHAYKN